MMLSNKICAGVIINMTSILGAVGFATAPACTAPGIACWV